MNIELFVVHFSIQDYDKILWTTIHFMFILLVRFCKVLCNTHVNISTTGRIVLVG